MRTDISVETALNSRCSSDSDGDPERGHWGRFESRALTKAEREMVVGATLVPRFTPHQLTVGWTDYLEFALEDGVGGIEGEMLHVESGMQHQAAHLACAALGLGACIFNVGREGSPGAPGFLRTARMLIQGMVPGYEGSAWSDKPPAGAHPWTLGNLSDPARSGTRPLLATLPGLAPAAEGPPAQEADLSQVLWAARGRTPHLVNGQELGMTIPTWGGGQTYTSVWVVNALGTHAYVNWEHDRPTHSLRRQADSPGEQVWDSLGLRPDGHAVIFSVNEEHKRALWEVGYMLLDALLQARARGIGYRGVMLDLPTRRELAAVGIRRAVAGVVV